jgi:hypothetical protein
MTWRLASFLVWGGLAALLVACGALAHASNERFPGVASLLASLTAGTLRRGALLLAWMWLGWHAFAR